MTVSDFIREAVDAYVSGESGAPFSARCAYRKAHRPGFKCIMCGGVNASRQ